MATSKIPAKILKRLKAVSAKRPKTVIDHIIQHGHITTEELKNLYGYDHPPRAARDVREQGIPLETFNVKGSSGRKIAAYRFGAWSDFRSDTLHGRKAFSKQFKVTLISQYSCQCSICGAKQNERYLQIDHRIPYEVAGDLGEEDRQTKDYMLLCSSCNRAKSWSCEHCPNWNEQRDPSVCLRCYWAWPETYNHVAMREIRRLDIEWQDEEVKVFDLLRQLAANEDTQMPEYVKRHLKRLIVH